MGSEQEGHRIHVVVAPPSKERWDVVSGRRLPTKQMRTMRVGESLTVAIAPLRATYASLQRFLNDTGLPWQFRVEELPRGAGKITRVR